ncbi:hypothetical protein AYI70_g10667, partial [Smittium culicis]
MYSSSSKFELSSDLVFLLKKSTAKCIPLSSLPSILISRGQV